MRVTLTHAEEANMAQATATGWLVVHDIVEAEHPLLDAEALRPCLEHTERKLLREVKENSQDA